MPGSLGPYDLERELGRGGMGRVFEARHRPTGARRALKILEGAPTPELLERFQREAQALARASGDGIVAVHESGVERGQLWYAMDLMPGGSLEERARRGPMPWREAAAVVSTVARALGRCHALGLVHRDLKPANILFDDDGAPRVADFGCVRDLGRSALTETGAMLGTVAYMAPEQLEGQKADARADVFALGVVLHELVAGERPFTAASALALHGAIRAGRRKPLTAVAGVPAALDELVARALGADGDRRPRDGEELARALDALLAAVEPARRAPLVAGALVLGVTLAVVLVAFARETAPQATAPPPPPPAATQGLPAPRRPRSEAVLAARENVEKAKRLQERLRISDLETLVADERELSFVAGLAPHAAEHGLSGAALSPQLRAAWSGTELDRACRAADRLALELKKNPDGMREDLRLRLEGKLGPIEELLGVAKCLRALPAVIAPVVSELTDRAVHCARERIVKSVPGEDPRTQQSALRALFEWSDHLAWPRRFRAALAYTGDADSRAMADRIAGEDPLLAAALFAKVLDDFGLENVGGRDAVLAADARVHALLAGAGELDPRWAHAIRFQAAKGTADQLVKLERSLAEAVEALGFAEKAIDAKDSQHERSEAAQTMISACIAVARRAHAAGDAPRATAAIARARAEASKIHKPETERRARKSIEEAERLLR